MTTFKELNLLQPLEQAIEEEGYTVPTPIQEQAIPAALAGQDILGCAQTGTGKTAAFCLPILNLLVSQEQKAVSKRPLVLVLSPTRELAVQIGESFATYGRHVEISHTVVYGGVGQESQVEAIEQGVHVLVATPGRLLDLIGQDCVYLNRLLVLVLDEADRMLDMGFLPDLKKIMKVLPLSRQSMFFSATMPPKIVKLSDKLLYDPFRIDVTPQDVSVESIDQRVIFVEHAQKKPFLVSLIRTDDVGQAIVFVKTKRGAGSVAEYLQQHDIKAIAIHGNKSQTARHEALDGFRDGQVQILVATDLAARGIDVDGLTHVFNFELPIDPEGYIHRIGRTGRAGAAGIAITLCTTDEIEKLRSIERLIGFEILEDGRQAEPLPEVVVGESDEGEGSGKGRRHRRSRRKADGPVVRDEDISPTPPKSHLEPELLRKVPKPRPTAADRKAARDRRRKPDKNSADEQV